LKKTDEAERKLLSLYDKWFNEVQKNSPDFFTNKDFSCPYYIGIPNGWFESDVRVLIVAENGFGYYGNGKDEGISPSDYKTLQSINLGELPKAVGNPDDGEHPFWTRARKIVDHGFPVAWTAIDKICIRRDRKSKLNDTDRERLHSVNTKILAEEIDILEPTIVIFFGWHELSLEHELPEVYGELYPNGKGDNSRWKNTVVSIEKERIYIFSYNPHNPYWRDKPQNYEESVIAEFEKHIVGKKPKKTLSFNENDEDANIRKAARSFVFKFLLSMAAVSFVIALGCYAYDPLLGTIMAIIFGLFILILIFSSGYMYKKRVSLLKAASENRNHEIYYQNEAYQRSNSSAGNQGLNNPATKVAASYALGRVAQEAYKNTEAYKKNHRNPNSDRYAQAIKGANDNSGPTYRLDEHICATCAFWQGKREVISKGGKKVVRLKRGDTSGRCQKKSRVIRVMERNCSMWKQM
jgi:hypothetical protein